jgi:hypothetical protein
METVFRVETAKKSPFQLYLLQCYEYHQTPFYLDGVIMKYLVILLTLFVLADPALAAPHGSTGECLEKYRPPLNDFEASRVNPVELMRYLIELCMPESAHSDELHYYKRLQIMDDDQQVSTLQASL